MQGLAGSSQLGIQSEGGGVGVDGLHATRLEPEQVSQLKVRVRNRPVERPGTAVGGLGLGIIALLLERMAQLQPDRQQIRLQRECPPIMSCRRWPVPRAPRLVACLDKPPE